MSCLGDCLDLGPPPDSILFMPPPPIPAFFRHDLPPFNSTSCLMVASQLCETSGGSSAISSMTTSLNQAPPERAGDYVELPRKDMEWTGIGDTWLLVLVVSSIGVLLLGALLAMFLLKCREMNMFGNPDCSVHRQMKNHHHHHEPRDCSSITNMNAPNKVPHPSEGALYHSGGTNDANRMVWATLTPRGTQHFIAENYPPDLMDYGGEGPEDHYETVDTVTPAAYYPKDYDYEDPTPLIESYQRHVHDDLLEPHHQYQDMRCSSLNNHTLRRNNLVAAHHHQVHRPRVSSPTRIEHPNLPPLNLHPHNKGGNTLKRNPTTGNGYRAVEGGTLPKYGL